MAHELTMTSEHFTGHQNSTVPIIKRSENIIKRTGKQCLILRLLLTLCNITLLAKHLSETLFYFFSPQIKGWETELIYHHSLEFPDLSMSSQNTC